MTARIRYLEWAVRRIPVARWDLATSGVLHVSPEELGPLPALDAWGELSAMASRVAARYEVPLAEVVPALGASGGLWVLVTSVLRPGDEALVEEPAYEPVYRLVEAAGARLVRFARRAADGYRLDATSILSALGPATRAVLITNPHNPSGVHTGDDEMRELAAALRGRAVELIVDEVYRELCEPAATARRLGDNVATVSSLTKCFGLGWARAGWVLARPEIAERAKVATMHMGGVLPSTVGAVGARALAEVDRLAARARRDGAEKRARVGAFMERHATRLRWVVPGGELQFGFVEDMRGSDVSEAIERGLDTHGVIVVPGAFFGAPSSFRMSWALPIDDLDEALGRLSATLELSPA